MLKRSFSPDQKWRVTIVAGALVILLALAVVVLLVNLLQNGGRLDPADLIFTIINPLFCVPFAVFLAKWDWLSGTVVIDDDGLHAQNKRGKVKRRLLWRDVETFIVTDREKYGGRYICLSSNARHAENAVTILDVFRTMDAVYGDAETLVLPLDEELLAFCEAHLDVTPIHVSEPGRLYR